MLAKVAPSMGSAATLSENIEFRRHRVRIGKTGARHPIDVARIPSDDPQSAQADLPGLGHSATEGPSSGPHGSGRSDATACCPISIRTTAAVAARAGSFALLTDISCSSELTNYHATSLFD